MLRTSIRSARAVGGRPSAAIASRQWQAVGLSRRRFADDKKPVNPAAKPASLPTSETNTSARTDAPEALDSKPVIPTENIPLTPPNPAVGVSSNSAPLSPPPSSPAGRPKKGIFRRLRSMVLTLAVLGALGFGGGVFYSRVNDNFHDFFTEYVPFGEQAVLYLEENDFRKRFQSISDKINKPRDTGAQVTIPAQSGASWRVADGGEPSGRQSSALDKAGKAVNKAVSSEPKAESKAAEAKEAVKAAVTPEPSPKSSTSSPVDSAKPTEPSAAAKKAPAPAPEEFKAPEVNERSRLPPIAPIDPLTVTDAMEPVVQDLVHMLNGIIYVVNADKAQGRYASTFDKAKDELSKVGGKIRDVKAQVEKEAAAEVKLRLDDFDQAANDLVKRVEAAMALQEAGWRSEFEAEMRKVKDTYDERVKLLMEREKQLSEERLNNRLLEQAVALKKKFSGEVRERVEKERDGRLGKLSDLSAAVADLEKLTLGANDVVDLSGKTQRLHVAVEAVRAGLENASQEAPRPFIRELVALKEISADDPVVGAAIASINPSAYQRGLPSPSQLVDRFRTVAGEVRKASLLPEDAGVASHASSWVLSKVMFKKEGLATGDDVESILTRAQTYLEEGNLDAAAREVNGLQGWAKTLSKDWLGEVRKVLEVQQALDVISTEARLQSLRVD